MNKTFNMSVAALVAVFLLSSCDRHADSDVIEVIGGHSSELRKIALSFSDNFNKSELEGLKPKFVAGDRIKVSNGSSSEDCVVVVEDDIASITTNLSGALTAVYPSEAAAMGGSDENEITGVKVSASQDGTFASANICMAKVEAEGSAALFEQQTALFRITPPAGTVLLEIKSLNTVSDGQRTGTAAAIQNTSSADAVITVGNGAEAFDDTVYVSFLPGVRLSDLSFDTGSAMKGIPMKSISNGNDFTAVGTIYTIGSGNWHEYVQIGSTKWARTNVGAESPTDYGDYFAWGETEPKGDYKWSTLKYCSEGDSDENAKFTKYVTDENYGTIDGKTVLDLEDDAANANWGGAWCMPTHDELKDLAASGYRWDSTDKGMHFGTEQNTIFLPAAGYTSDNEFSLGEGLYGDYWSSSLYQKKNDSDSYSDADAQVLYFYYFIVVKCNPNSFGGRHGGRSVRPVFR